ncbi:MAG: 4-hydroxy-tetrahydrodipicolinate synthase [Clostridiales Family XIII bacterium]|jgi:4-hydroxy-tetrahydrodipicolinate synthase|nr:4-hydroxy-tetrahydrodipicolinate synthase [Clostridiales Family XIII bacterium]
MAIFKGSGVAAVTPFKGGKVDFERYGGLLDWFVEAGSDAIISCGTTGEVSTLTQAEQIETIRFAVERVAGRVPLIAGAGNNETAVAVSNSELAQKAGADALLVVTPYYNKASRRGLIEHFGTVAASTDLPVILYSVASRTGVNIAPDVCEELAEIPNIAGIKEASGDISQIAEIARVTRGKGFDIWSGNDDMIVPLMSLGGVGVISTVANIIPKETHDMCAAWFDGDFAKARDLQLWMNPLVNAVFMEVNPIPIKAALHLMGKVLYEYRLPMCPMEDGNFEKLRTLMEGYGLILP